MVTKIYKGLRTLALAVPLKGLYSSGKIAVFISRINIKLLFTVVLLSGIFVQSGYAANRYSVANGNWNSTATWSSTSGGSSGASFPVSGDVVYIEGGFTVTVSGASAVATTIIISSGSTLSTTSNLNLTATTITVNGLFLNGSTGTISGTMTVGNGGTYQHNINGGTIKTATWNTGSTCNVSGVTSSTSLTGLTQSFYNLTWSSANTNAYSIAPTAINGDFNVTTGSTGSLRINTSPFTIAGNLNLSGTSKFQIASSSTAKTLNVNGNFSMSGGTCTFSNGSGIGTLNVKGNYSHSGGTITESSSGSGNIVFNGTSTQTFTSGGTVSNSINYTVNSGAALQMADASTVVSGAAFTLSSGASLGITSNAGITSSGAAGNIQTTSRTFNTGANYTYNGTSAQVTGSGLPATVNNLTINNSAGVTASGSFTVSGILYLQSANASSTQGCLEMSSFTLTMGASATTTGTGDLTGTVKRTSFVVNTPYTFGNQFTTMNFPAGGTLPTDVTFIIRIGSAPSWKSSSIQRTYDIFRTGGDASTLVTFNLHYLNSELNGNNENDLVIWDYHSTVPKVEEHGKSNANTTDKWVGVSNRKITYFATVANDHLWTLSKSESPYFTWLGAQDTDWNNLNNWSTGSIPTDTSNVVIPSSATVVYDPRLPASTSVKTITINSGGILFGNSGTLTITGSVGAWYNLGTFNAGTSTVVFTNANATMCDPTNFYNVTVADGAKLTLGTDNVMRIAGTLSLSSTGVLNATINHNTVEFNGTDQTIILPNGSTSGYHNLILSGSGTKTLPSTTLDLYGDFTLSGNISATAQNTINTTGNFVIGSGCTFIADSYNHSIGGNFSNSGTFTSAGSTITMNGYTAQTISGSPAFNNLIIESYASTILAGNTSIAGNLTISSGKTFNLSTYTCNRNTSGGTLTIAGRLKLGGNSGGQTGSNFPLNFNVMNLAGSTLEYYGSSQTVYSGVQNNSIVISGSDAVIMPSGDFNLDDFELNNASGVSLVGDLTINRLLNLNNGILTLGSYNLTLGSAATVSGDPSGNNMVDATGTGELRKVFTGTGSFVFPVGSFGTSLDYSPVTLNFTSGTFSSAYAGVKLSTQKHPNNASSTNYLNRYWAVSQSGISNFSCGVTLQYLPSDVAGNEADIWCAKYNGSYWYLLSAANPDLNQISGTVTSLGDFTGGEQGVLPVTLTSLISSVNGRNIKLNWITSSEINNVGFEIERASINKEVPVYTKTGFVSGKGTINTPSNYSFDDKNLQSGKYMYRLKQIDANGNFSYFNLNNDVEVGVPSKYDLSQNYPNPFNPKTKINFELPYDSKIKIILFDVTGREIKTIVNEIRTAGYHTILFDGSDISSGVYFYRIIANSNGKDYIATKKMVLVK